MCRPPEGGEGPRESGDRALVPQRIHFQHWLALKVMVLCDLYEGEVESAHGRLSKAWGALDESGLLRIQLMRIDAFLLRGTVSIASSQKDSRRLALATRDAAALEAEERPAAQGGAALLRAGIAAARGQRTAARTEYTIAARELSRAEVRLHAACATLSCGSPEEPESVRALAALAGEGIVRPERFVRVFAPVAG